MRDGALAVKSVVGFVLEWLWKETIHDG
jgi:hypothetical protein